MNRKKIVVLGGGTGTFTVLSGLKHHPVDLSAVVSIADNGGSTGVLRDELGVLPPGDIRQCLVALSSGDRILRDLFNYRFHEGSLSGHNFGNLFLSALEKVTGDSLSAVREAQRILNVRGRVIPVSDKAANLVAELMDGTVLEGEHAIDVSPDVRSAIWRCYLSPSVEANPEAIEVIKEADVVVMGPGDLFTSLIPVLLIKGIPEALGESRARKIFIMNLMTKRGQTDGFTAGKFLQTVEQTILPAKINTILMHEGDLPVHLVQKYAGAGEKPVVNDLKDEPRVFRAPLTTQNIAQPMAGDVLPRSLLRHDPERLAVAILQSLY